MQDNLIQYYKNVGFDYEKVFALKKDIFEKLEKENMQNISDAKELLVDEKSKVLYDSIIAYRKGEAKSPCPDLSEVQYFPSDINFLKNTKKLNFIDCGACGGDSIIQAFKSHKNINF